MRGGGEGESFRLVATCEWCGGRTIAYEEAKSWMNVCGERLRRVCLAETGEGVGQDVVQVWTNEMGGVKWTGAQGGLTILCAEVLRYM